jgi:hypothetical protein
MAYQSKIGKASWCARQSNCRRVSRPEHPAQASSAGNGIPCISVVSTGVCGRWKAQVSRLDASLKVSVDASAVSSVQLHSGAGPQQRPDSRDRLAHGERDRDPKPRHCDSVRTGRSRISEASPSPGRSDSQSRERWPFCFAHEPLAGGGYLLRAIA